MLDEFQALLHHPWMDSLISLMSILVAIVVYLRSRNHPVIAYEIQSVIFLRDAGASAEKTSKGKNLSIYRSGLPEGVEVFWYGMRVDQLVRSSVILWNSGSQTFRKADLVSSDPLRLELSSGRILAARITAVTRAVNGFSVLAQESSPPMALINFDYLDPGDGATIELVHTSKTSPALLGSIRGLPRGPRAKEVSSNDNPLGAIGIAVPRTTLARVTLGVAIASLVGGAAIAYWGDVIEGITITALGFLLLLTAWTLQRRCPSILITEHIL
jgi:hypothetical protein